ncbi:MAG: hypothetical protein QOI85_2164 [Chloroflexota bacterium]|jgi:hypothetical protein|nr:hypothetical protein [Chloroflexota bacterium]
MNPLAGRAAALVGWLAHAAGRLVGGIIWFAPRGVPWALGIAALLAVGAWRSVDGASAAAAAQPRPEPVGLADVVDLRAIGWVGTSSIVRGPFLDSSSYGAPVQRWYYLLTDPLDDDVAMVARSPERLEERRVRTIVARVDIDPAAVEAALSGLDAGPLSVDPDRYLVELADRRPSILTGDGIASPTGSGLEAGEVVLRGSFAGARQAGDGWEYLVSDQGRAVIVHSPYPPDALPVDVWGVATTDRVRAEQAAAVPALQESLGGRRLPERRLLAEGVTPPLSEVSYLPAMVLAMLAAVLLLGWLIGYPVFRRTQLPDRISSWPMHPGDEVTADLYGTDRRGATPVVVDGAPARLALYAPDELERRTWQFAIGNAGGLAPTPVDRPGAERGVLALASGEGPILVELDPGTHDLRTDSGTVVHAGQARPGLRIRGSGIDLVAAFASVAERDRALVAIVPDRLGSVLHEEPPHSDIARRAPPIGGVPVPVRAAAVMLAVAGAVLVVGGAIGLPGALAGRSELIPSVAQLLPGIGFGAVARGVWLRRGWALGVGFNVAWVGAAISAFLIVAAPQCGLWLAPNLAACEAIGPLGSVAALVAAIGLAYAALAIRRHASAFVR